jgi:hypothetical protein
MAAFLAGSKRSANLQEALMAQWVARWSSGNDDQLAPEKAYARVVFVTRARCR